MGEAQALRDQIASVLSLCSNEGGPFDSYRSDANVVLTVFAQFLRDRSARKQARALDVEQTISEMLS